MSPDGGETPPFEHSGFAATTDLGAGAWRELFARMEVEQQEFLQIEPHGRDYLWPRDALHNWSRLWEYPFAFHHLSKLRTMEGPAAGLQVADIGSGVTFFPFSIARLGYQVTCIDVDPVCARDIPAAANRFNHAPGAVKFGLLEGTTIPLADGSQDAVYCISVLEHIPDMRGTVRELLRILKPGGRLILTVDVDLRGDSELGVAAFDGLKNYLATHMRQVVPERSVHPSALLTSENSPHPLLHARRWGRAKQVIKNALRGNAVGGRAAVQSYLAVYGTVLERK